jgi:hypothetical protein
MYSYIEESFVIAQLASHNLHNKLSNGYNTYRKEHRFDFNFYLLSHSSQWSHTAQSSLFVKNVVYDDHDGVVYIIWIYDDMKMWWGVGDGDGAIQRICAHNNNFHNININSSGY